MAHKADDRLRKLLKTVHSKEPEKVVRGKKKEPRDLEIDMSRVGEMSESELVEVAHALGFETASRLLPRDELIDLVSFRRESPVPEDQVQKIRERTYQYVDGNRRIMPSGLPCDLDCPNCPSRRVVECYAVNSDLVD